ncbi:MULTISPECIES: NUDIX hydrolase [Lysobacter]|jgi:8-oxo-dGTP pyrophosphatase MutT (NUDIX family)|uniref:NUDIX domain-containing protein n=1 Tax=Lysobacter gummosus TaxID=262324 RepID=A0ABY3XK51_9GAMM|nr:MULTISPECIES: NUDIX domain-containing protein [Lysobacter]ALN91654.1 NUDIX domain protein [Lysobacter gummosus]UJB21329.1 NUDIX domain-containing protein [Lysobacter capsici]UJQ29555.1 NUDIX domain-containing protein [Lysobacter gummosus]UNP31999.1 NUDIX domain-containing protein [Lysobacter gummosus]
MSETANPPSADSRAGAPMVGAVLIRDGRLLLGLRNAYKRLAPNCWDILGGHVEAGETLEQALLRELEEEAGVVATDYCQLGEPLIWAGASLTVYRVDAWQGEVAMRGDEHVRLQWFDPVQARALPNLADGRLIELIGRLRR